MDLILIGFGGALGSLARYQLGKMIAARARAGFPAGTLLINSAGAVLLGLVSGAGLKGPLLLLAADGFLGAFTTFSTFMYEGFQLVKDRDKLNAAIYIAGTMVIGLAGFLAGYWLPNIF